MQSAEVMVTSFSMTSPTRFLPFFDSCAAFRNAWVFTAAAGVSECHGLDYKSRGQKPGQRGEDALSRGAADTWEEAASVDAWGFSAVCSRDAGFGIPLQALQIGTISESCW
jgi:hypothetical protein